MSSGRVAGRAPASLGAGATYYEVLGVADSATAADIRARYRQLSKTHHPDAGGDRARFELLAEAHAVLVDPKRRAAYDESLIAPESVTVAQPEHRYLHDQPIYTEYDFNDSRRRPAIRLAMYMSVLVALVAGGIYFGADKAEELANRIWPEDSSILGGPLIAVSEGRNDPPAADASPVTVPVTVPEGFKGHNGLNADESAQRWLAAFQALSGLNPPVDAADAEAVYSTELDFEPGVLCRTYTKADFWVSLSAVSFELTDVQRELNHHLSRAVAECDNFDQIIPVLSVSLGTDRATIADRLRKVEQLADEAVWTPGSI